MEQESKLEQPNHPNSQLNSPTGKLSIWWKLSLIIIVPLDILAVANWLVKNNQKIIC